MATPQWVRPCTLSLPEVYALPLMVFGSGGELNFARITTLARKHHSRAGHARIGHDLQIPAIDQASTVCRIPVGFRGARPAERTASRTACPRWQSKRVTTHPATLVEATVLGMLSRPEQDRI